MASSASSASSPQNAGGRPLSPAQRIYYRFFNLVRYLRPLFLLLIRLYIGYQCAIAGYYHFKNFNQTADFFHSLHIPMPKVNVAIAATTELVGGALLVIGLGARLASIPLMFNFLVAIVSVQLDAADGNFNKLLHGIWNNQDIILKDTAFPFLITAIILFLWGPGCFSVDYFLARRQKRSAAATRSAA